MHMHDGSMTKLKLSFFAGGIIPKIFKSNDMTVVLSGMLCWCSCEFVNVIEFINIPPCHHFHIKRNLKFLY